MNGICRTPRLFQALISCAVVIAASAPAATATATTTTTTTTTTTGYLEVCKTASGPGVTGDFQFTVSGKPGTVTASVNGCSTPITVPAGQVVVTEVARAGFVVADVTASPADRLLSKNPAGRTATVRVVAGGIDKQTIVTFTNKTTPPPKGTVKVCKIAGSGIAAGEEFSFTVGGAPTKARAGACSLPVEVPAGDVVVTEAPVAGVVVSAITAAPSGTLLSSNLAARTATVRVAANQVTEVTFTNKKQTGTVKVCKVAGPGVVAGQEFAFIVGGVQTTARAGACSLPVTLPTGQATVRETGPAGFEVTAITVAGAGSLVSRDLVRASAVVNVAVGVTEITFTNKAKNRPPSCTNVRATPNELWPPNHRFETVTLGGATDPDGDTTTITITGVTQDEALNGTGDGDTAPDAASVAGRTDQVKLRAERSGNGDGRVYRISFTVSDGSLSCSRTAYVGVPHDRSGAPAVDTTSVVVNSFGP